MYCKKCGNRLPEDATICPGCNARVKEAVFCHKCSAELPANSSFCTNCGTKSHAQKSGLHWLPIGLAVIALIFYSWGGYYYFDEVLGEYNYELPYSTVFDYLSLITSLAAIIIAAVSIPGTRKVLKVISIILAAIMIWLSADWLVYSLL